MIAGPSKYFDRFQPMDNMLKEDSEPASEDDLKEGLTNMSETPEVSGSTLLNFFNQLQVKNQSNQMPYNKFNLKGKVLPHINSDNIKEEPLEECLVEFEKDRQKKDTHNQSKKWLNKKGNIIICLSLKLSGGGGLILMIE